ncbi:MAG: ChaN family lipoprotein [Pseudomonadota bacterium]
MRYVLALAFSSAALTAGASSLLPADAMAKMKEADIVILGEVHDNPEHHQMQAQFIDQLAPAAVVFEMLTSEMAAQVGGFDGDLADLGDAIGWEARGWPDFDIYLPIFQQMKDARPVGAATQPEQVRAAFMQGAAAVFGDDAAAFTLAGSLPTDQQKARAQLQFTAHCEAMPMDMMGGMIEAQRYRDAAFSRAAISAYQAHGGPIVVVTGYGHARKDWAMPFMLAAAAPELSVFSLGLLETPGSPDDPRFDAAIVTAPTEREDPCAAFAK